MFPRWLTTLLMFTAITAGGVGVHASVWDTSASVERIFAPYVDVMLWPTPSLVTMNKETEIGRAHV